MLQNSQRNFGDLSMQIAINGDLGGGKSSLAREIAKVTGANFASTGAIQRGIAESRGLSVTELNLLAEWDEGFDALLKSATLKLALEYRDIVFDSRLAFFFLAEAFSIHLLTHPAVAGTRLLSTERGVVETYGSAQQASAGLLDRRALERERYRKKYGIDMSLLSNYDLVIQTDLVDEYTVQTFVLSTLEAGLKKAKHGAIYLNPRSVVPIVEAPKFEIDGEDDPLQVLRRGDASFAISGLAHLQRALQHDEDFVEVNLIAQDRQLFRGVPVSQFVVSEFSVSRILDWQSLTGKSVPSIYYQDLLND